MLPRAGVIPTALATNLAAELDEWDVERGAHERLFVLAEQAHRRGDMFGVTVVTGDGDGLLFDSAICELVGDRLDHERFHHASTVTQHISSEGMEDPVAVCPSHRSVHRCLRYVVPPIVHQRLPFDISACGDALDTFAER